MNLITLNIWGGRVGNSFPAFFASKQEIDIWCFQEILNHKGTELATKDMIQVQGFQPDTELFSSLEGHLPQYEGLFCPVFRGVYGIAAFLKKGIKVLDSGDITIARGDWDREHPDKDHDRKIMWMKLSAGGKDFLLVNGHLTHRPEGKEDSEKRIAQSQTIIDFLKTSDLPKILVGDFNLMPHTQSIKMIEDARMINLIKKYNIESTRTELYKKQWKFADYIFVSPEIKVNDFKVLPDIVSDHCPLFLDFEVV